jgi:hypothetical protein
MMIPKKRLALALALAAVGAPAGFLISEAASGDDPPVLWRPTTTDAVVHATAEQKAAFAVLASTQRTEDTDNGLVEDLAERSGVGMDADGARVVGATTTGPIWLIPTNGGLCLGLADTAGTTLGAACEPSGDVIARGMTVGDGTAVYGIVPDDTTAVSDTPTGGSPQTVALDAGNVYTIPTPASVVSVTDAGGSTPFGVDGG